MPEGKSGVVEGRGQLQMVEAGKEVLPSWLRFVGGEDQNVLQGVPTPADAGQVFLQVTARGPGGLSATDIFSLTVTPDTSSMSLGQPLRLKTSGPAAVHCKHEEPETVATIFVDADLGKMVVERRLELLDAFLKHMGLGEDMVKIVPASGPLHDGSALVTGTGDLSGDPQYMGVTMTWLVGCGKVESGHFPLLHKLDSDSTSGKMAQVLGLPVVGWRVTNSRLQQQQRALKRMRRQVKATPTPVITISPPTATDDADHMTRPVIAMSSPTFTIEPSPTESEMPKTTTTSVPTTTPKMVKPDVITTTRKPDVRPPKVTKTEPLPTTRVPTEKPPTQPVEKCDRPRVNVDFPKKTLLVGEVIDFQIPEDLFDACGKGGTSETKLTLFKYDEEDSKKHVITRDYFLQFDQRRQTIRGMPSDQDVGRHPLVLVAMLKTHDYITTFTFEVVVRSAKGRKARVNHELSMTIDTNYDDFVANLDNKLDLTAKVASVFGDSNPSALTVTSIKRGSVVYAFTNNTLAGSGCPIGDITSMADKLVTADGRLSAKALMKLEPWVMTAAAISPVGDCDGNPDFPKRSASVAKQPTFVTTDKPVMPDATDEPKPDKPDLVKTTTAPTKNITGVASAGKGGGDNIWITTVVPAVVIVAILLVALLVACILYRKKRKGTLNLEEQNTFVNKGAPVIFPDELDEKPSDSTKPLLIEGSPPAAPPEYHRGDSHGSNGANKEATPPTDEVDAEIEIDATSPLYQPPPPVPANSGKQARPHVQQPYRSQPPEIHP